MSSELHHAEEDARYWAEQVAGIAARRDVTCFMRVFDHYAPRLNRYLLGLKASPAQAEELVQECLLRLWRRAELFDPARASLSTWLFRVARNLYIDGLRREPRWLPIQEGLDRLEQSDWQEDDSSAAADHLGLAQAIEALPAVQARLIRMSYFEAKSHSEIAHELGMPLGSVKSNIRRAFSKLQSCLRSGE